ncbi:MAG: hypothetical protein R3F62_03895 [Planctomycetota bacterium]
MDRPEAEHREDPSPDAAETPAEDAQPTAPRHEEIQTAPEALRLADGSSALELEADELAYSLDRAPSKHGRRALLTVQRVGSSSPPFRDVVCLYSFRSRHALARALAVRFNRQAGHVLGHLALLLDQVERAEAERGHDEQVVLTPERRAQALSLLEAPDLLARAGQALSELGYVGEDAVKQLAYLIATSRLLPKPLSGILMAPSGAGKSDLLDRLTELLPAEAVQFLSRLSPAALYYAGPNALRHRLVIVDEQAGASGADYSIRTLQTKGYLRQAVSIGGRAEHVEAHGPISLLSGTTSHQLDPENLSRCLELALDDSPEQTRRIHDAQRLAWADERRRPPDTLAWQDAQRLLVPGRVVIPFASAISFPARTTRDRRDLQKVFGLVAAHALLLQHQRERRGEAVVATPEDYRVVYRLLQPVLRHSLDGLSPRAGRVYALLSEAEGALTRRAIAERCGWNYMTSVRALDELVAQELVVVSKPQPPREYSLVDRGLTFDARGLTRPDALETFTAGSLDGAPPADGLGANVHAHSPGASAAPGSQPPASPRPAPGEAPAVTPSQALETRRG